MTRRAGRLVLALAAVTVLVSGCAASIEGSPDVDPAAASALAAAESASSAPETPTSNTPQEPTSSASVSLPNVSSSNAPNSPIPSSASPSSQTPIPPIAPSTPVSSDGGTDVVTTSAPTTKPSGDTTGDVVHGVDVETIAASLPKHPVYADADIVATADPNALASLKAQVKDARAGGLDIWVVLIGHDVDALTDVSDAIETRAGGTAVVVTTSHFAVSSKQFSHAQLTTAEDVAAAASSTVEAASLLVDQFRGMATSSKPTQSTTTAGGGQDTSLSSFQLADHSIGCIILDDLVRCDIVVKHSYTPPKNPHPDCEGDYGSSIQMAAKGAAAFICVSDTAYDPTAPVLKDGDDTLVGEVMCFADGPEVSCFNLESAHGFALSPSDYQTF